MDAHHNVPFWAWASLILAPDADRPRMTGLAAETVGRAKLLHQQRADEPLAQQRSIPRRHKDLWITLFHNNPLPPVTRLEALFPGVIRKYLYFLLPPLLPLSLRGKQYAHYILLDICIL